LNEAYGEFLSTVSHELRTPLTSIRGSLELAQGGAAGEVSPELKDLIDVASSNTRRLGRLVDDVLDLQKMDAGHLKLEPERCDLRAVLRDAVEANRGFADAFEVGLALEESADPLPAYVDSDRIVQVLTNLISNAVKFSPARGEVRIRGEQRGKGAVRVFVEDRGPGIPPDLRDRVFDRFAQARGAHPVKGTGLGLSIAKAIVERHGGAIGFETDAARGTTFFFELPVEPPLRTDSDGAAHE
jgi:signal transduction histidine kinase